MSEGVDTAWLRENLFAEGGSPKPPRWGRRMLALSITGGLIAVLGLGAATALRHTPQEPPAPTAPTSSSASAEPELPRWSGKPAPGYERNPTWKITVDDGTAWGATPLGVVTVTATKLTLFDIESGKKVFTTAIEKGTTVTSTAVAAVGESHDRTLLWATKEDDGATVHWIGSAGKAAQAPLPDADCDLAVGGSHALAVCGDLTWRLEGKKFVAVPQSDKLAVLGRSMARSWASTEIRW